MQSLEVGTQHHLVTATGKAPTYDTMQGSTPSPTGQQAREEHPGVTHLRHLLLVQLEHLARTGGGDLLKSQVARVGAVTAVPGQHEDHLEDRLPTVTSGGRTPTLGDLGIMTLSVQEDQEGCRVGAGQGAQPETQQVLLKSTTKNGTETDSFWSGP